MAWSRRTDEIEDQDPENEYSEEWLVKRKKAGEELLNIFNGNWQSSEIVHYCNVDCLCSTNEESVQRA